MALLLTYAVGGGKKTVCRKEAWAGNEIVHIQVPFPNLLEGGGGGLRTYM